MKKLTLCRRHNFLRSRLTRMAHQTPATKKQRNADSSRTPQAKRARSDSTDFEGTSRRLDFESRNARIARGPSTVGDSMRYVDFNNVEGYTNKFWVFTPDSSNINCMPLELCSQIVKGTSTNNRLGDHIRLHSLRISGYTYPYGANRQCMGSMWLIYDRKPSAVFNIEDYVARNSSTNLALATCLLPRPSTRFTVLRKWLFTKVGNTAYAGSGYELIKHPGTNSEGGFSAFEYLYMPLNQYSYEPFDEYIDLKGLPVEYSGVSTVQRGALRFILLGEATRPDEAIQRSGMAFVSNFRLRFEDTTGVCQR